MAKKSTPKKMSIAEINARYNPNVLIPAKIQAGLKKLGNAAMNEYEFRGLAEVNAPSLARHREDFAEHLVEVRERGDTRYLWCGTTEFAIKVRKALTE